MQVITACVVSYIKKIRFRFGHFNNVWGKQQQHYSLSSVAGLFLHEQNQFYPNKVILVSCQLKWSRYITVYIWSAIARLFCDASSKKSH